MVAATTHYNGGDTEPPPEMKIPLVASAIFHGAIVILALVGLPYIAKPPPDNIMAIPIEILPIAEMTMTTKPPAITPPPEEKPPEKVEPVQKEAPPAPPKVEAVEPPKPPAPPKPKAEPKPAPKPVAPPPPQEKLEKPAEKKPEPKVEEKPKEEPPKEEPPKEETQVQDFQSLLKNLQDSKPAPEPTLPTAPDAPAPQPAPNAPLGAAMTMDELAALRAQLSRCWSIQAGARYAENLAVEVRLIVAQDRRVISASIVDQWRYGQDSYFRAAADSAIRAINAPQCETLELNPEKYNLWKDMIVTFDPREML